VASAEKQNCLGVLCAVHFLDVINRILDCIDKIELLLELMIDGAHPFTMQLGSLSYADEADAGALRIGGADEELFARRVLNILNCHFVDLKIDARELEIVHLLPCFAAHLYVWLVCVRWIRKLRFLAGNVGKDDVLFEQKDLQFFGLLHGARIAFWIVALDTVEHAMQQQLALRRNLSLKLLQSANVHHVIGSFWNDLDKRRQEFSKQAPSVWLCSWLTLIIFKALLSSSPSSISPARLVCFKISLINNSYFMILCTGLMSKSQSCKRTRV